MHEEAASASPLIRLRWRASGSASGELLDAASPRPAGGHFATADEPEALSADIVAFLADL